MRRVKLGEICEINIGKTPSRLEKSFWNGEFCWLSISDMKSKFLSQTKEKITDKAINSTNMKIVRKGTVVMSFKLSIGKVAILSEDMYTNEAIANFVIKNNYDILTDYLYYALQSLKFDHLGDRAVMGKTLNKAKLNNLSIIFYEPNEQRKIVDKLDVISNLIDYRQKQFKELSNLVKSRFYEMFGDLSENPYSFPIVHLSEIAEYYNGLTYKPEMVVEDGSGTIVLRSSNIQDSKLDFNDIVRVNIQAKEKNIVRKNDILMCSRNGSERLVGKTAIINKTEKMYFGAFMMLIRSKHFEFLQQYFQTEHFRSTVRQGATTTINQITVKMMDKVKIPLPPLALQNQFADFVAEVDKSQLAIKKSLEELETLKKSLMQAYFG